MWASVDTRTAEEQRGTTSASSKSWSGWAETRIRTCGLRLPCVHAGFEKRDHDVEQYRKMQPLIDAVENPRRSGAPAHGTRSLGGKS